MQASFSNLLSHNYFNLSAAVALLIVYKVENQYSIWQMRALWSGCQDSVVLSITQLSVIRGICLLEGRGPKIFRLICSSLYKQGPPCSPLPFHLINPLWICCSFLFPSLSLFLHSCLCLHPDVPVPLLQVHQHWPESSQNARDDTALCPAHVTLPPVPGHAQQQDPPAVSPHTPPQRGSWLCW